MKKKASTKKAPVKKSGQRKIADTRKVASEKNVVLNKSIRRLKEKKKQLEKKVEVMRSLVPYVPYYQELLQINQEMGFHVSGPGKPPKLTANILSSFLDYAKRYGNLEDAAIEAFFPVRTMYDYLSGSETFSQLARHARDFIVRMAEKAIGEAITGRSERWKEVINPKTKEKELVYVEEVSPNLDAVKFYLERRRPQRFARRVVEALPAEPEEDLSEAYPHSELEEKLYAKLREKTTIYERQLTIKN